MKTKTFLTASLLFALSSAMSAVAAGDQGCTATRDGRLVCPQPDSTCMTDPDGNVLCSTSGGGIEFDRYGKPACGPGYCTKDQRGNVLCSRDPRGAASTDQDGNAVCAGSCVPARSEACVKLKPSK